MLSIRKEKKLRDAFVYKLGHHLKQAAFDVRLHLQRVRVEPGDGQASMPLVGFLIVLVPFQQALTKTERNDLSMLRTYLVTSAVQDQILAFSPSSSLDHCFL